MRILDSCFLLSARMLRVCAELNFSSSTAIPDFADNELPDLLVANTDVTIQAPIDDYYQNLTVRLEELKNEFTNLEARTGHEQTFEDYIQGDREFAEGVQQNSQRYPTFK